MDKIVVSSPAKINLGLNIVGKREDGFHNLETIFYPIKLCDEITFTKSDKFSFNSNNELLNKENDNLIIKAKDILEKYSNKSLKCNIYLEKNIPIGAGLGGGSSNAATTLLALNKLFKLNLSKIELENFALELGSDVPFFLNPIPSFAKSRGEILKPLQNKLNGYILIVNPGIHISTKWAFQNSNFSLKQYSLNNLFNSSLQLIDLKDKVTNDFEEIAFKEYPQIQNIKYSLYEMGASFSLMTGTGSTVYGLFGKSYNAEIANDKFKEEYFTFVSEL